VNSLLLHHLFTPLYRVFTSTGRPTGTLRHRWACWWTATGTRWLGKLLGE